MPTASRLTWIQAAPEPGDLHFAECGPFSFEIIHTHDRDYLLQMWRYPPEDSPLLWWEHDGFSLDEAKAKAQRLADHHVPAIAQWKHRDMLEVGGGECYNPLRRALRFALWPTKNTSTSSGRE